MDSHINIIKSDPYLTPHTKINSKLMKDLSAGAQTIKLLEENVDRNLCDLRLGKRFQDMKHTSQRKNKLKIWRLSGK